MLVLLVNLSSYQCLSASVITSHVRPRERDAEHRHTLMRALFGNRNTDSNTGKNTNTGRAAKRSYTLICEAERTATVLALVNASCSGRFRHVCNISPQICDLDLATQ